MYLPCLVPVRRFPVPLGQFFSVTYPRRTGGKRLDKNRMRMRALPFEIWKKLKDDVNVVSSKQAGSRRFWLLTTLVDVYRIDFCRPALKSHQNVIHSPMKLYTAPSISSFQLSYRSLPLANFQSKHNIDPCVVNLDLKSWIIRKTILSNKIH